MKKLDLIVIIAVVLMILLPSVVFAGGDMEEGIDTGFYDVAETISSGYPKINITYEQIGEKNFIYFQPKGWNVDYGIVKVIEDGQTIYRNVTKEAERLTGLNWNEYYDNTTPPSIITLTDESTNTFSNLISLAGSSNSTSAISLIRELSNSYDDNPLKSFRGKKAAIMYKDYSADIEFDLLLFNEKKSEYLRLRLVLKTEFFKGENDLFNDVIGSYTYEEKAVSFLGRVLGADFINNYDSLNTGISEINWELFDPETIALFNRYKEDFKRKMSLHFESIADTNWETGYPVIDTAAMFEGIYGTKKNVYINTYLKYIYSQNKPALSEVYTDLFNKEHRVYNYTNYKPLTGDEGIILARNAMRYYTWGVEYTPFSGYNTIVKTEGMNDVWEGFGNEPDLQAWIASGTPGDKADNYAASVHSLSGESTPPVNVPTYSSNGVDNVTLKASTKEAVKISRIDLWSAENIAWDNTVGKNLLLYKVNVDFPATVDLAEYTDIEVTPAQREFPGDGDLYKEDSETMVGSIKLDRDATKGIGIGYEFTDRQRSIQSLLVIKGRSPSDTQDPDLYPVMNKIEDEGREYYSIYYDADGSDNWIKLEPSEYIECVTDNVNNNYTFYPETKDRKPGYGIWNNWFSNDEKEIVYSYLIFKYPIECTKILLVDRSENDYLSITELGVFDADPLQHLNHEGVQAVETEGSLVKEISWTTSEVTGVNIVGTNLENIMLNGNPAAEYSINDSTGYINIQAKAMAPLRHLIAWTADDAHKKLSVQKKVFGLAGDTSIQNNEFFVALTNLGQQNTWDGVKDLIDTPFLNKNFLGITTSKALGNSLPYVPGGIDSPRTFAYKMAEQMDAGNGDSTKALDDSYEQGYVRKEDFAGLEDNKPFLPGFYILNGTGGYDDSFRPEMTAGVDDIGIVQGAMAMMENVSFTNIDENDLTADLNSFYAMNSPRPGLESLLPDDYFPVFTAQADSSNSYENILRMTPADIEKISIIVPDISFIQPGDILIRNTENNKHLGVIAGFKGTQPTTATSAPDWWENILVLSTRPGFQSATLGTWGNPNGLFGGFTEHPEEYLVRRLMKVKANTDPLGDDTVIWESVRSVHFQWYDSYVVEGLVPWDSIVEDKTLFSGENRLNTFALNAEISTFREMPPTSYQSNRVTQSLVEITTGQPEIMKITNFTGWRNFSSISYHRGLDVVPENSFIKTLVNNNTFEELNDEVQVYKTDVSILAPESGKFWIIDQEWNYKNNTGNYLYIRIDDSNYLLLERRREPSFGDLGILVTNPESPEKGRIYVFAHMYYNQCNTEYGSFPPEDKYIKINSEDIISESIPTDYSNGVRVEVGDWLGFMGGNRGTGLINDFIPYAPHVHFEVYEYFPQYLTQIESKKIIDRQNLVKEIYGYDLTEEEIKTNLKWQRIDPRTVFKQNLFVVASDADETQKLINGVTSNPPVPWESVNQKAFEKHFQSWDFWTKITEED